MKKLLIKFSSLQDLKHETTVISRNVCDYEEQAKLCQKGSEDFLRFEALQEEINTAKLKYPELNLYNEHLFYSVYQIVKTSF